MIKSPVFNKYFLKYFQNTSWMMAENILKIVASFFVAIYIARFLGPEEFGTLTYVISIVFLFMGVARLGMETILVRELVKEPEASNDYMGSAFALMLLGSIASILVIGLYTYFFEASYQIRLYLALMSIGLLFQPFLVVDFNFQSKINVKFSSIAKSFSYILGSSVKIYMVFIKAPLIYFVVAYIIDYFVIALLLYLMHIYKKQPANFFHIRMKYVRILLKSAFPLVLSSFTMSLYMTIDKILIKHFLGLDSLGVYSAALKMYEGWLFFPIVVGTSLLPALVKLKQGSELSYQKNMTRIFSLVIWSSLLIALVATFFSEWIIQSTFGEAYQGASDSLIIIMWASAFIGIGTISYTYFTVEKMENKLIIRTLMALVINLTLDIVLIPVYGIEGAAIATLVSVIIAYYLIDIVDPETQTLMRIKTKAFLLQIT